ncbi:MULTISPECIES: hypothetical protein [Mesorhizobium]|uniref:hypothetical protein n=1 Tax=Mesorhizobium TaxID=68287 RepID=UPI0007FF5865|nr:MULTISPECIES: hypothetical protein [Mesorhizobium]MUT27368.1 hypothetical protein [Mesorhizobium japonicum]OBQ78742.1 hypothetical protein A9K71_29670 [Mesorhizobium sp. WSM3873]
MVSRSPARPNKFEVGTQIYLRAEPLAVMQFAFSTVIIPCTQGIAEADYAGFSWIGKSDCLDETYLFPKWSEKPLGELAFPRRQTMRQCWAAHGRVGPIDPVSLKDMLGDIQANCGNLLHGRLSLM